MTIAVSSIFKDARAVHAQALEQLEQGDIRDAAEKAWCATKRATDALILSRTGQEPQKFPHTSKELDSLAEIDSRIKVLVGRYYSRQSSLHGDCFYLGLCEPRKTIERRIRETDQYIRDAEGLADSE
jgi:hypothetical protein